MKILFVADVFGAPGRSMLSTYLPKIKEQHAIDFVIVNGENSAHGKGITAEIYKQILDLGTDVITMGNHTWDKPDIGEILIKPRIIRPYNLSPYFKYSENGIGTIELTKKGLKIRVTNIIGVSITSFKGMQTNSFKAMEKILNTIIDKPDIHIVDLHAETTSEKYAFLWAFNGKVDAILGTHTHVPTNDCGITEEGTVIVCDVGMTGPSQGVIGAKRDDVIKHFLDPSTRFGLEVQKGPRQFSAVILEYDEKAKRMVGVQPVYIREGFTGPLPTITQID